MIRLVAALGLVISLSGFIFYSGTAVTPPASNVCRVMSFGTTTTVIPNNLSVDFPGC